jgi:hypothetical protein
VDPFFEWFEEITDGRLVGAPGVQDEVLLKSASGMRKPSVRTFFFSSHGFNSRMYALSSSTYTIPWNPISFHSQILQEARGVVS